MKAQCVLYITLVVFLGVGFSLYGQSPMIIFDRLGPDSALPGNSVHTFFQDHEGIVWMLSFDGLIRYNGYDFEVFKHSNTDSTTLTGNHLLAVAEDRMQRLWVSARSDGLNVSDPAKTRFHRLPVGPGNPVRSHTIAALLVDGEGKTWVGGNAGLDIVTYERNACHIDSTLLGVTREVDSISRVTAMLRGCRDDIWIGTEDGVILYSPVSGSLHTPASDSGFVDRYVDDIEQGPDSTIWISCRGEGPRLYYLTHGSMQFIPFREVIPESPNKRTRFAFDRDGRLWLSTFGERLYGYDFRDSTIFLVSSENSNVRQERFFRDPFLDEEGNIWIPGSSGTSVAIYRYLYPRGFQQYHHPYGFDQAATAICKVNDELWIAYLDNGVVRTGSDGNTIAHLSSTSADRARLFSDRVLAITHLSNRNVAMAAFGALLMFDPSAMSASHYKVGGTCRTVFEDSHQQLWLGGFGHLYTFDAEGNLLNTLAMPANSAGPVQAIAEDKNGRIWFTESNRGMTLLDPATWVVEQFLAADGDNNSLPSNKVIDLAYRNDILWIGTDAGLCKYDITSGSFISYGLEQNLADEHVAAVLATDKGTWVSTFSGLSFLDPTLERFVNYTRSDGLLNWTYIDRSKFLAADGTIFFGGPDGVDYFNPAQLKAGSSDIRMHLVLFKVDQKILDRRSVTNGHSVPLKYNDDILEIEFAGLTYAHPEQVEYAYHLEGLHSDWVHLGKRRSALIAHLEPGQYTFRARARHPNREWSSTQLVIPIQVAPPFWATWWFRMLGLILVLATAFGLMRHREKRILLKQTKENEIQRTLTDLEKRALLAQMNPHFIFNAMSSIQRSIVQRDIDGAQKYLLKFSRLLRTVLNISGESTITLANEIQLIEDYLEIERMRFPNKFSYKIEISEDVDMTTEIPPFMIQPQVENAITHGLLNKKTPGHLHISITSENDHLKVTVTDNGIGRKAAGALRVFDIDSKSKGLSIVEQRLQHINLNEAYHKVHVTDLYGKDHSPQGTRVEIYIECE